MRLQAGDKCDAGRGDRTVYLDSDLDLVVPAARLREQEVYSVL